MRWVRGSTSAPSQPISGGSWPRTGAEQDVARGVNTASCLRASVRSRSRVPAMSAACSLDTDASSRVKGSTRARSKPSPNSRRPIVRERPGRAAPRAQEVRAQGVGRGVGHLDDLVAEGGQQLGGRRHRRYDLRRDGQAHRRTVTTPTRSRCAPGPSTSPISGSFAAGRCFSTSA